MECFSVSAGSGGVSWRCILGEYAGYNIIIEYVCSQWYIHPQWYTSTSAYDREEAPIDNARDLIKVVYDCLAFLSMPGTII